MKPLAGLVVALLVSVGWAGCAGTGEEAIEDGGAAACTLMLPDGMPHDCKGEGVDEDAVVSGEPPATASGWFCTEHSERGGRVHQVYSDGQGGVGIWWDWAAFMDGLQLPAGGVGVIHVAFFPETGDAVGVHLPMDPERVRGYYELPVDSQGEEDQVVVNVRVFYLMVQNGTEWEFTQEGRLIVDRFDADGWYAWNWTRPPGGYLNVMRTLEEPSAYAQHAYPMPDVEARFGQTLVGASTWQLGHRFADVGATAKPQVSGCTVQTPV